jgi:predicted DNA-binding transcriptional regulator AlpA
MSSKSPRPIIRLPKVLGEYWPGGKTSLDDAEARGETPARVPLTDGGRMVAWFESEWIEWLERRKAERDARLALVNKPVQDAIAKISSPKVAKRKRQRQEA